jgi:hypothetical protein
MATTEAVKSVKRPLFGQETTIADNVLSSTPPLDARAATFVSEEAALGSLSGSRYRVLAGRFFLYSATDSLL